MAFVERQNKRPFSSAYVKEAALFDASQKVRRITWRKRDWIERRYGTDAYTHIHELCIMANSEALRAYWYNWYSTKSRYHLSRGWSMIDNITQMIKPSILDRMFG